MTDPNGQQDYPEKPVQDAEPVISKPYIMPDDPEVGSVEALTKEAAESRDKMLRTLAEMENLRKRTTREVADARTYGIANFARDVLAVADNMERALKALDDEIRANAEAGVKSLLDGVELTERELIKAMEKHGIKRLEP